VTAVLESVIPMPDATTEIDIVAVAALTPVPVARTVTVPEPEGALVAAAKVSDAVVAPEAMGDALTVTPVGRLSTSSETAPAKPPRRVTVTPTLADPPVVSVRLEFETEMDMLPVPPPVAVTDTGIVVVRSGYPEPRARRVAFEEVGVALPEAATVIAVDVAPLGMVAVVAVTPPGSPSSTRSMGPLNAPVRAAVIVSVLVPPTATESADGDTATENPPAVVLPAVTVAVSVAPLNASNSSRRMYQSPADGFATWHRSMLVGLSEPQTIWLDRVGLGTRDT
jgi:hypothetical protein